MDILFGTSIKMNPMKRNDEVSPKYVIVQRGVILQLRWGGLRRSDVATSDWALAKALGRVRWDLGKWPWRADSKSQNLRWAFCQLTHQLISQWVSRRTFYLPSWTVTSILLWPCRIWFIYLIFWENKFLVCLDHPLFLIFESNVIYIF